MTAQDTSTVTSQLASETIDWMAEDPLVREDITDEVWAFALTTYVGRTAITPRGHDVTNKLRGTAVCIDCGEKLTDEPDGSSLCRRCFIDGI